MKPLKVAGLLLLGGYLGAWAMNYNWLTRVMPFLGEQISDEAEDWLQGN